MSTSHVQGTTPSERYKDEQDWSWMSGDTEPEVALVAVNTVTQGKGSRVTEHRDTGGR